MSVVDPSQTIYSSLAPVRVASALRALTPMACSADPLLAIMQELRGEHEFVLQPHLDAAGVEFRADDLAAMKLRLSNSSRADAKRTA